MKRILVPIDFSEQSKNAAKYAGQIAKEYNAEVELIHILDTILDPKTGESLAIDPVTGMVLEWTIKTDSIISQYSSYLEKIESKINQTGVLTSHRIVDRKIFTSIGKTIVHEAEISEADLIVLGTNGVNNMMQEAIVGSNASKVIQLSKCPVISVRDEANINIKDIVYISNFKEQKLDRNLENAIQIADKFGSTITLLQVSTPVHFEYTLESEKRFESIKNKYPSVNLKTKVFNSGTIVNGVYQYEKKYAPDLIIMATHGYTGLMHISNENYAEGVVQYCKTPVLIYK